MSAIAFVARRSIRRRWRSLVVVTLLIGLAGAVVLTATAGARRSASALERFRSYSRAADLELDVNAATPAQLAALRAVPAVESVGRLYQFTITDPTSSDGTILPIAAALDDSFGNDVDRPLLVRGRLPRRTEPSELAVGESIAKRFHLSLGQRLTLGSYTPQQIQRLEESQTVNQPSGPTVRFHIVGVVRRPLDLGVTGAFGGVLVPTPAFYEQNRDRIGSFVGELLRVRSRSGQAGVPQIVKAARTIFPDSNLGVVGVGTDTEGARDAIGVLTAALWIFSGVAAVAGITAVGIVVIRQIVSEAGDQRMLAALGLTAGQRAWALGALAVPVAVAGGLLAVVGAVLASPILPFGLARQAEVDRGFHADWLVLGLGLVAVVGFVAAVGAVTAWRVARPRVSTRGAQLMGRPSVAARLAASAGATPRMTTGLRMALEPGTGSTSVPVRSAFFGAGMGTLGIVAVLVFSASLGSLVATPHRYGWSWDAVLHSDTVGLGGQTKVCGDVKLPIIGDKTFDGISGICFESFQIDGHPVTAWGFTALQGHIEPTIATGRAPEGLHEIALGASVLEQTHKRIGDTVTVRGDGGTGRFTVVGQVVLPSLQSDDPEPLAGGAALTGQGFSRLLPKTYNPNVNLVATVAPGAHVARNRGGGMQFAPHVSGTGPLLPVEVDRINQIGHLPGLLAGLLAVLTLVAVGHAIVLGMRRRRRDLAVLRTIGFERRDVRLTIAYQSMVLTGLGLLVGVPAGIVAGRLVWRLVADGLGVAPFTSVPALRVILVVVGALLLAFVFGAVAASVALRDRPATVLTRE
ncbi:MAG: hypothetical protein JWL73_1746 [Actinomycetia bacterium]|nr:hypothetical protein [Actinomycetes bacterium]